MVKQGTEKGAYVEIKHGKQYTLSLRNHRNVECDAEIKIDSTHIGTFRIPSQQKIELERPSNDTGNFTFYKSGTKKGNKAGIVQGKSDNGLIEATFTPTKTCKP